MGDKRSGITLAETVRGIVSAGSLVCQRIAAHSVVLGAVKNGAQRVIRFAKGGSTQRSQMDAAHLTERLRRAGLSQLAQGTSDEVGFILGESDLRKPYAREMPDLMGVRALDGRLVPGYRTLNVLSMTAQRRGILYHCLFSSQERDFTSEKVEVQQALQTVSQALGALKQRWAVTWIMDRGLADIAVWRTIWEAGEQPVCRIQHSEGRVVFVGAGGEGQAGVMAEVQARLRVWARVETRMRVCLGRQKRAKMQPIVVEIGSCPLRLSYRSNTALRLRASLSSSAFPTPPSYDGMSWKFANCGRNTFSPP